MTPGTECAEVTRALEDDTDACVALFITDETVDMPATIARLDEAGNDVASHPRVPRPVNRAA
jgi:hypothetical protein